TNAANSYLGSTTILGGSLQLSSATTNNNIASSSTIDVQAGAGLDVTGLGSGASAGRFDLAGGQALQGNGTVSRAGQALAGAQLTPGEPPAGGILNTGDLTLTSGSKFVVNIHGNTVGPGNGGYSQDIVTGRVSLGGATLNLSAFNYTPAVGDQYVIIKNN